MTLNGARCVDSKDITLFGDWYTGDGGAGIITFDRCSERDEAECATDEEFRSYVT